MEFAEYILPDPIVIQLAREQESLDNIKQHYNKYRNQDEKYQAISIIFGVITIGYAIIFCRDGHSVAVLSGDLTVEQWFAGLNRFRAGLKKVLITTNVLSWGIAINLVGSDRSMMICRSFEKHFQKKIQLLDAEYSDVIEKIGS
ncbi:DEAD-box helicase Dbp80-like [Topomyia yanbarensis]|uniref:DEAD-box helicase Dbp80-like n=1 Tax=Topomyia yanbarensis TaxID=2498891 RepID=UPI00273BA628|nr:DEAD-box helicase Dbp80-like [Topomyia yanbarensis]